MYNYYICKIYRSIPSHKSQIRSKTHVKYINYYHKGVLHSNIIIYLFYYIHSLWDYWHRDMQWPFLVLVYFSSSMGLRTAILLVFSPFNFVVCPLFFVDLFDFFMNTIKYLLSYPIKSIFNAEYPDKLFSTF